MKRKGWRNEPVRHGLASQGVETTVKGHKYDVEPIRMIDVYNKEDIENLTEKQLKHILSYNNIGLSYDKIRYPDWIDENVDIVKKWLNDEELNEDEEERLLLVIDPYTAKLGRVTQQIGNGGLLQLYMNGYADPSNRKYILDEAMSAIDEYCEDEGAKKEALSILDNLKEKIKYDAHEDDWGNYVLNETAEEDIGVLSNRWYDLVDGWDESPLWDGIKKGRLKKKEIIYDGGSW